MATDADSQVDLVELLDASESPGDSYTVTVIAIPDFGAQYNVRSWSDGSDGSACWLSTLLPRFLDKPYVLEFAHGLAEDNTFSWQQVAHSGDILLKRLLSRAAEPAFLQRPLIFICHGLGGIVAKRAIGVLYERFHDVSFEKLISVYSGIMFLGSPHPTFEKPQEWAKLALVLKACTKLSKKVVDRSSGDVFAVANISQKFDESGSGAPVLSAFEGKLTKVNLNLLSSKREILVDESLARTGARGETLVKVNTFHGDMCNLPAFSSLLDKLEDFLYSAKTFITPPSMANSPKGPRSYAGWSGTSFSDLGLEDASPPISSNLGMKLASLGSSDASKFDMLPLSWGISGVSRTVNLPCYMLKPHMPNPEFYGRKAVLQSLRDALTPPISKDHVTASVGLKTFALCGIGGVGKTQIAIEYAYASKNEFDAIFFLQASDTGKLAQGFADIAIELGLETLATAGDQAVSKDLVLGWLSQPFRRLQDGAKLTNAASSFDTNWLIIFDNADDLSVLGDYWPVTGNGSILLTSRDPLAKTRSHIPIEKGLDLEPFSAAEAGTMLRELTGFRTAKDRETSETIARKLSGLPLAITQIARTIGRRSLSLEELLALYNDQSLRLEFHQAEFGLNPKTLYNVWSFQDLSSDGLGLLKLISFLDPDQIPEDLLTVKIKHNNERDYKLPSQAYPSSLKSFIDARTELSKSSLIKRNIELKTLIIHRIVQDATRVRMDVAEFKEGFGDTVNLLYCSWPFGEFEHSTERWRLCEPLVPHINNLHHLYDTSESLRNNESARPDLARLFMDLGQYYMERGNIDESRPLFKSSQHICELAPKECVITFGDVHGRQAQIGTLTNDVESALFHAKASLSIFEGHGDCGFRLPQANNELAEAYIAAGMYEEAIVDCDLATIRYKILPEECGYFEWSQINKGFSLCNLGRYEEASKVLEDYLQYREKTFGPMDTQSFKAGIGMLFLGRVRGCQGRLDESLDLYLKALAQYHSTIGPKHFRVAALYIKLGETSGMLDQAKEATVMYSKALQTYGDRAAYNAPVARTYFKLAQAHSSLGLLDQAVQDLRKANELLDVLSQKYKRKITEADLDSLIPNWSK